MNSITKEVTPLTRGIIWLAKGEVNTKNPHYADLDYLLDGLLTANLKHTSSSTSRVIVAQNFTFPLYVMIVTDLRLPELESYLSLLKNLSPENDILVIDETGGVESLRVAIGELSSHLRVIQDLRS